MLKIGLSRLMQAADRHRDAGLTVGELLLILVVGAIAIGGAWLTMRQSEAPNRQTPIPAQGTQPLSKPANSPVANP
jgi:hypothetical protein